MQPCPWAYGLYPIHKHDEGALHLLFQVIDEVVLSRIEPGKLLL